MTFDSQYDQEYKKEDEGFIDGYIRGGNDVPFAIVVIKGNFFLAPMQHLKFDGFLGNETH